MLRKIKNLIAFLTIIPVGMDQNCLADAANYMYLFPLIGAFIGVLAGAFAWMLFNLLDSSIVGALTTGFILLITGIHHLDGLLDFGDGIMYHGPPDKKIEVMRDQQTGAGGFALGTVTILATALCISQLKQGSAIQSLVVCEVSAKSTMVLMAWIARSAHEGMNTYFVKAMHGQHRNFRLSASMLIAFGIASLMGAAGFAALIAGLATALILVWASNRHFRGVTGDVFGAGNELARLNSLIIVLAVSRWV
ncbi:MAG: adenosylcobinamide-GDP ribazoletransferase [Candidatus Freyarchaeota archaeon]